MLPCIGPSVDEERPNEMDREAKRMAKWSEDGEGSTAHGSEASKSAEERENDGALSSEVEQRREEARPNAEVTAMVDEKETAGAQELVEQGVKGVPRLRIDCFCCAEAALSDRPS